MKTSRCLEWSVVLSLALSTGTSAQAPEVEWRRSEHAPSHPTRGPQSPEASGEDWWYDHANSRTGTGALDGYVAAGFSSFVEWAYDESASGGCLRLTLDDPNCAAFESAENRRGVAASSLALVDQASVDRLWFDIYNIGNFHRVIQTSDHGFAATGFAQSTRDFDGNPLPYNPGQEPNQLADHFDLGVACPAQGGGRPHAVLLKVDRSGKPQWQHLLGLRPYRDGTGAPDPAAAYQAASVGYDLVELPSGGLLVVGESEDPPHTYQCNGQQTLKRGLIVELTADGRWVDGRFFGPATYSSKINAVATHGSGDDLRYVIAGTRYFRGAALNPFTACDFYQKAFVAQLRPDFSLDWYLTDFAFEDAQSQTSSQSVEDVAIGASGEILLPVIVECTGCLYAATNFGRARVFRLDTSGTVLGSTDLGTVTAFDLKLRLTPTSDGGFAVVSTRQTSRPPSLYSCYDTGYWNTDAWVAKLNRSGVLEWQTTFDVDNVPRGTYPGDEKKQECLYTITEHADGGLVVSGNNSYNFDDDYLAKLAPAPPRRPGPDLSIQDTPGDVGLEPNPDPGPMWISSDLWVRHERDGGFEHQNPRYDAGGANWVYVRVTNRGAAPASGEVKLYWAKASTGLRWPEHWVDYRVGPVLFGDRVPTTLVVSDLPPGHSKVVSFRWEVPNPADFTSFGADRAHFCLLARIETSATPPFGMAFAEGANVGLNTKNNNNVAWRNVTLVEGPMKKEYVVIRNVDDEPASVRLAFSAGRAAPGTLATFFEHGRITVALEPDLFRSIVEGRPVGRGFRVGGDRIEILEPEATIGVFHLAPGEAHVLELEFRSADGAPLARELSFDVLQFQTGERGEELVGGQRFALGGVGPIRGDLAIEIDDGRASAVAGALLELTVVAINRGATAIDGAVVSVPAPFGSADAAWTCVPSAGSSCGSVGAGGIDDLVDLAPGGQATYTLSAAVAPTFFGDLEWQAAILPPAGVTDLRPRDNTAMDRTTILPPSGVAATKTVASSARPGSRVTYTILLLNGGPVPQPDNPGSELVDVLPPELELVSASADTGVVGLDLATGTVTWNGAIPSYGTVTVRVEAAIGAAVAVGTLVHNQGTVFYDTDGDGTNDGTSSTDDPGRRGTADPTDLRIVAAIEVPTLSPGALLLLIAALAGSAVWRLARAYR